VTRYLLDTNIICNVTKPAPSEPLLLWMAEQIDEDLFIASLTVAEIRRGVLEKPAGRKCNQLDAYRGGPRPRLQPYSTNPDHETQYPSDDVSVVGRVRRVVNELR
jgi:predicted nucleic acid-binding protein